MTFATDYERLYHELEAKNRESITGPLNLRIEAQSREIAQWKAVCEAQKEDIAKLRESNEALVATLKRLACLGNGDAYGSSTGNFIAQDALEKARMK